MRIGVIGTGRIGAFHVGTLRGLPEPPDVLVTDVNAEAAQAVAAATGSDVAPSVDELFAAGLDGVVIASATDTHAPLLRRALEEGVAVFCEKPVARTLPEAIVLARLEQASEVPVQIGFQRRWDPGYRRARQALRDGDLGELHQVRCATHDPQPPPPAYVALSGGIFRDCSIHDFDVLRFVTGTEVEQVYASGGSKGDPSFAAAGDTATAAAILTLTDGTVALVTAMRYNGAGYDVRMELHGTTGALAVGLDDSTALRSAEPGVAGPGGTPHRTFMDRFRTAYVRELAAFAEVARGERASECTVADGLEALRIAEACDLSQREGRVVHLAEIADVASDGIPDEFDGKTTPESATEQP
ncbi:MAG: Gfo/Idh/MocA family oxidoreductase [Actinomycetia bacterium]|nr:Gfo/Idh/MocA family oxidoreductase [Actinomycetes bacterium]